MQTPKNHLWLEVIFLTWFEKFHTVNACYVLQQSCSDYYIIVSYSCACTIILAHNVDDIVTTEDDH